MDIQPLHHRPDGPPVTESGRDVERRRERFRREKRRAAAAGCEANPNQYIKLPSLLGCKACRSALVACHVLKSNSDPLRCGSCSYQRCSLVTEDVESKNVLRSWLVRQLALDTNNAARLGLSAAPSHASTTAPCSSSTSTPMDSTSRSNPLGLTESLTDTTVLKSHDTITSAQSPIIDNSSIAQLHQLPGDDSSQSTGSKRPRDSDAMADHMVSDKTAKTARVDSNTGTDPDFAHYLTGLVSCHEQESTRLKDAIAERDEAVKTIRRQSTVIAGLHPIRDEMGRRIWALEAERDQLLRCAAVKEGEAKKLSLENGVEMNGMRKELETAKSDLQKIKGGIVESTQAADMDMEMEKGDQSRLAGLRLDSQNLEDQHAAAVKIASRYRQNELEAQASLTKSQAENTRLVGQVRQLTVSVEYEVIQLEELRQDQGRLRATVVDLEKDKAGLAILKCSQRQLLSENTRLSNKLVVANETIAQQKAKSTVTNDRLEEQQTITTQLREANVKLDEMAAKVLKQEIKVRGAEMAEKTITTSFKHRTGELNKDLEKAYKRINNLEKTVGRLRRREQERSNLREGVETGDVIDLSLID